MKNVKNYISAKVEFNITFYFIRIVLINTVSLEIHRFKLGRQLALVYYIQYIHAIVTFSGAKHKFFTF